MPTDTKLKAFGGLTLQMANSTSTIDKSLNCSMLQLLPIYGVLRHYYNYVLCYSLKHYITFGGSQKKNTTNYELLYYVGRYVRKQYRLSISNLAIMTRASCIASL